MNKFLFKILFKMFLVALIICCLSSIISTIASWNYKPENRTISNPILSGIETVVLNSEKELPFESSFGKDEKTKAFITFERKILKIWLYIPEISRKFLCQEIEIIKSEQLSRKKSWLLFMGSSGFDFHIKNISLKNNLLEIELGVSHGFDILGIFIFVTMIGIMFLMIL